MTSTPDDLTRIYASWNTMLTWDEFGYATQDDLNAIKNQWFPGDGVMGIKLQSCWTKHPAHQRSIALAEKEDRHFKKRTLSMLTAITNFLTANQDIILQLSDKCNFDIIEESSRHLKGSSLHSRCDEERTSNNNCSNLENNNNNSITVEETIVMVKCTDEQVNQKSSHTRKKARIAESVVIHSYDSDTSEICTINDKL